MSDNKKTWVKKRHQRVYKFFKPIFGTVLKNMGYTYEKYDLGQRPHMILCNHLTRMDQYMMCLLFDKMMYFVARDDLFSSRAFSRFLEYTCAPIPKSKVMKDIRTIKNCVQVASEGGNIALFPEGNLSYDGYLGSFYLATAKLVKLLKLPLVLVNNVGGYGSMPRWSAKYRKGSFTMKVVRTLEYDEYKDMPAEELQDLIKNTISVDNFNTNELYKSNNKAERLELFLYVCPHCGLSTFRSKGDKVRCTKCNATWTYGENLKFTPDAPFVNTGDWQLYQTDFVNKLDITDNDKPLYAEKIKWVRREVDGKYKAKVYLNPTLELYVDKFVFAKGKKRTEFPFKDITSMAALGRNKMEMYAHGDKYFFQPDKYTNGLKYMQLFYHYQAVINGTPNGTLGL